MPTSELGLALNHAIDNFGKSLDKFGDLLVHLEILLSNSGLKNLNGEHPKLSIAHWDLNSYRLQVEFCRNMIENKVFFFKTKLELSKWHDPLSLWIMAWLRRRSIQKNIDGYQKEIKQFALPLAVIYQKEELIKKRAMNLYLAIEELRQAEEKRQIEEVLGRAVKPQEKSELGTNIKNIIKDYGPLLLKKAVVPGLIAILSAFVDPTGTLASVLSVGEIVS